MRGVISSKPSKSSTSTADKPGLLSTPGPNLAPPTIFPQYTSGAWANLPTGTWGAPTPTTPTTPTTPATPTTPGQSSALRQSIGGLLGSVGGAKSSLSSLSPESLAMLTQGWGLFGGGAAMPTTRGPYQHAFNRYKWQ